MALYKETNLLIDYIPDYLEDCLARGQADETAKTKESLLNLFITWATTKGVHKVDEMSLDVLESYRKHLYRYRKPATRKPLQLATQRMRLMAIKGYLKFLHYYSVLDSDFYKKFELPRVPRKLPKNIPEPSDVERIFLQTEVAGFLKLRDRALLELLYATGIRRCELARLDIAHIEFKHRVVWVHNGKGSQDRVVPIADRALYWIKRYIDELRPKLASIESGDALFLGLRGQRLELSALTELVGNYVARSGVGKQGACHLFRHTAATHMVRGGADVRFVQEFLGHKDINSTIIYTHLTINDLSEVYSDCHPAAL
jgi:integrase/recombinase XerD